MLTYIDKARKAGYAVMILRPNTNSATISNTSDSSSNNIAGEKIFIKGSESPEIHALYVWENFICKCDNIKMVSLLGINVTTNTILHTNTTIYNNTIKDMVMVLVYVRILLFEKWFVIMKITMNSFEFKALCL